MLLPLIALFSLSLCHNSTLIGYVSIRGKLLASLVTNQTNITVKANERFNMTFATVTPYRWTVYVAYTYPHIRCRQKIIDKETLGAAEEVVQVFECRATGQGEASAVARLRAMDSRLKARDEYETTVWVNVGSANVSDALNESLPKTVPTIPPVNEIPNEVLALNSYNRWTTKKKGREEHMEPGGNNRYDGYGYDPYDYYDDDDDFYRYFDDDDDFIYDYDFDFDYDDYDYYEDFHYDDFYY